MDDLAWIVPTCKDSFEQFAREFWDCIPGVGKLVWNWHLSVFCHELQTVMRRIYRAERKQYDLIFNVPFGTSKSSFSSILFPAWTWSWFPEARFICASHTDSLVIDLADKAKSVIESEKYRECFPDVRIRSDKGAKEDYANTLGGERKSCTVGGKTPTGRHCHAIIVDDPLDPQGALSEAALEKAERFMTQVIPSRVVDKEIATTILVMQRIHYRDPTAVMVEVAKKENATPVRQICLPGELSDRVNPPELRDKYIDGVMDVARMPWHVLKNFRAMLGEYGYAGQVQQEPTPPGGGMFKRHYFNNRCKAAPYHAKRVRYVDRASTADGGCYTAMVLMARDADNNYYVEHVVHGQWEPDERNRQMRATALHDRSKYGPKNEPIIYVEAEGGSSGIDAWKSVAKALAGFRVMEDRPTGSKDVRAEPWSSQCAAGNVWLVEDGTWDVNGYIQEHCLFRPEIGKRLGKFKDQVDASSGAFNLLLGMRAEIGIRVLSARKPQSGLRLVVASKDELANCIIDQRALLVAVSDPLANGELPGHAIDKLMDSLVINFADLDPADYQDRWNDPVMPWDKKPSELIVEQTTGKKLWAFLLKKRDPKPEVIVFADDGDRRAHSTALAICDGLNLAREQSVYLIGEPEAKLTKETLPKNRHVYEMIKRCRAMVV